MLPATFRTFHRQPLASYVVVRRVSSARYLLVTEFGALRAPLCEVKVAELLCQEPRSAVVGDPRDDTSLAQCRKLKLAIRTTLQPCTGASSISSPELNRLHRSTPRPSLLSEVGGCTIGQRLARRSHYRPLASAKACQKLVAKAVSWCLKA